MLVVATAGHVDHGKSTLVRALTGMEPDRWAEERRRGMTIDLGHAWTTLADGEAVAFVDVPGHQRFIGNMLAGLGPAPAVMVVVAADEGWRRQSAEHLAAVDALQLRHGLLVVTRCDLADPTAATVQSLEQMRTSSLGDVPVVEVSGRTGAGLPALRAALSGLAGTRADHDAPVRLWVDRSFTVRGAGTVVTGTLGAGSLAVGDRLRLLGRSGDREVRVRGLQSLGSDVASVQGVARVAVNLRGVERGQIGRGDLLLAPVGWRSTATLDARVSRRHRLVERLVLHVGTAAVPVRVRQLDKDLVRLTLDRPLPLVAGDRALLRDPAEQVVTAGVLVLDPDPPALSRRGAAAARAADLGGGGAPRTSTALVSPEAENLAPHSVPAPLWARWSAELVAAVDEHALRCPLEVGLSEAAALQALRLPDRDLWAALVTAAGLERSAGRVRRPGAVPDLGPAEAAVRSLEERLAARPFEAPDAEQLRTLGLGVKVLAAAETAGRLLRLGPGLVLLPTAPERALGLLRGLTQPFTVSQARQALGTSRRVAVPLLEVLDATGSTVRVDAAHRRVAD